MQKSQENGADALWVGEEGLSVLGLPDLQKETGLSRAVIKEQGFPRTQEFAIEYRDGEAWKELAHGTVVDGEKQIKFSPVSARWIRLNILKATDTPTIEEFQVF